MNFNDITPTKEKENRKNTPVAKIVDAAWNRCKVPSSIFNAITPWQLPELQYQSTINLMKSTLDTQKKILYIIFSYVHAIKKMVNL